MRRKLLVLAIGLTACATAHKDSIGGRPDSGITIGDSNNQNIDAPIGGMVDAPPGGGGTRTLSQTTANNDTAVGIACSGSNTAQTIFWTAQNSYYRVFQLSNYAINGTFHVTGIDFINSYSQHSPALKVSVGTFNGTTGGNTFDATGINVVQSTMITPPDTTTATPLHVDLAADITGNLVVEIDQNTAGSSTTPITFYIGANEAGESVPGYVSSTDSACGITVPTSMNSVAQAQTTPTMSHMVLTVTGST